MPLSEIQKAEVAAARRRTEDILASGPGDALALEGLNLPAHLETEVQERLRSEQDLRMRAIALLKVLDWLAVSAPSEALGAAFALQAVWANLDGIDDGSTSEGRVSRSNLALILQNITFSLHALGAFDEVLVLASDFIPVLQRHRMPLSALALQVASAEAAWGLGQPAAARAGLPSRAEIRQAGEEQQAAADSILGATLVRRDNLAFELSSQERAGIAETRPVGERNDLVLDETIEAVRSLLARSGAGNEQIDAAIRKLEALKDGAAQTPDELRTQAIGLVATVEEILSPLAPGLPSIAARLRTANDALGSTDEAACNEALADLAHLKRRAEAARDIDGWLSHTWLESLVLEKHGRLGAALETLDALSKTRDELARGAGSATERAGLSSSFGDLALRRAMLRLRLGAEPEAAFDAIENGKGRWISEGLPSETLTVLQLRSSYAGERIHYLTYAVGSEATVAVFVPAEGEPSATEIPIGRAEIGRVATELLYRPGFRAAIAANLADRLGLLTAWLPAPSDGGMVRPGDTLIIAPHGPLHSIPMHVLPASDGLPLAPRLAVARTHGAALVARGTGADVRRPSTAVALRALVQGETQLVRRAAGFQSLVDDLAGLLPCTVLGGASADYERLRATLRPGQVVHLFAHGDATANAPYSRSGLLLPSGGRLPMRGWDAFQTDHLVSPERINGTTFAGALAGSHITLQACVSGHAQANLGGDAIGLEWSLLLSGAASVLATHWHVDFATSTEFCRTFYGLWLGAGLSRVEAWRRSAEALQAADSSGAWAAFSLTGDWR